MSSIEERVKKIVVEQLGVKEEDVTVDASFVDDLGADSLDTVDWLWRLKKNLNAKFLTKMLKKLPRFSKPLNLSRITKPNSGASLSWGDLY